MPPFGPRSIRAADPDVVCSLAVEGPLMARLRRCAMSAIRSLAGAKWTLNRPN